MKKSSLTSRRIPALLLVALILSCGTVLAYMFKQSGPETVEFTPAAVTCAPKIETTGDVTITKTSEISVYLRVRPVTYWVDTNNKILPKEADPITFTLKDGWLAGSDGMYYYTMPVPPNTAGVPFSGVIGLKTDTDGNKQVVDILCEAIQADPVDAVKESWHVTLDADGNIERAPGSR